VDGLTKYSGLKIIILLGLISLFGDLVYEGGRSVLPELMRQLGLTAVGVGFIMGSAELAGWVSRPLGGIIADRVGRHDVIVRAGYLALIVMPLMALSTNWWMLTILVFIERVSRGLRIPARDALLARGRGEISLGSAFGIHEFLDQFGGLAGPILLAVTLMIHGDVRVALLYSLAPYVVLAFLTTRLPKVSGGETGHQGSQGLDRRVYLFTLAATLNVAGLLPLPVILYKVSWLASGSEWIVPATYALAMATDAAVAMPLGRLYERKGIKVVISTILLAIVPASLILGDLTSLLACAGLVGVVIGSQESVFRAVVARIASMGSLGSAYGVFGLGIGLGYALAGGVYGILVDSEVDLAYFLLYASALQLASLYVLRKILASL